VVGILPVSLVLFSWVRYLSTMRTTTSSLFRKIMTAVSLLALTANCVMMAQVYFVSDKLVRSGDAAGDWPRLSNCLAGVLVAIVGAVFAASSVDSVRDFLGLASACFLFVWVLLISEFQPMGW